MNLDDKTILITGAHGFLGHHVVERFRKHSKKVKLVIPTRKELDLFNEADIRASFWQHKPTIVIHLAAQCGGIGINREKPGEFLYNNLKMTTNLIEACRAINAADILPHVEKFVGIGTVCSYPKHTPVPFKEEDLYNGYPEETNAPYGLSKRMQLDMLKAYRMQYGFNGIFLIPVNMLGEWDNFNDDSSHVIPSMMKKFHRAKLDKAFSVELWGDGSASREFLYAGDCADAILSATLVYNDSEPVNIGTGKEITIRDLAEKMREVVGFKGKITWNISKPNGQPRRCLDVSRASKAFNFVAKSDFDKVLRKTYRWAKENNVL